MTARALVLTTVVAAAAARVVQIDDPTPFPDVKRALVVFAHPDDAETICGGLVATLIAQGTEVTYVVATNGDKGWSKNYNMTSAELAVIRQQEQLNAAAVMGVSNVTFLGNEVCYRRTSHPQSPFAALPHPHRANLATSCRAGRPPGGRRPDRAEEEHHDRHPHLPTGCCDCVFA